MKVLSLGLDKSILEPESRLAQRAIKIGQMLEKYVVVVPAQKNVTIELSSNVTVFGRGSRCKALALLKIYRTAKKILSAEKFDVITSQDPYFLALVAARLSKKFNVGLEIQVHGWEKFSGLRRLVAKYTASKADVIRVVSQRLKKQIMSEFGVSEEKITVAPIYTDLRLKNYDLRIRKGEDKFIFLTVGRLVKVKNIGMQIEAMAEVIKKYPQAELWIVGDGPERKNFQFSIFNFQLTDNIKLLGWKNDLSEFYGQADVFLLTSDYEGWGLAVVEAATGGLPIIMTDVGCAGELIKNNESGLVIPVGDKDKLAGAMLKLIGDQDFGRRLGENANKAVKSLPNEAETLALYKISWERAILNK